MPHGIEDYQEGPSHTAVVMTDEDLFRIGGILHEARMVECYGTAQLSSRKAWPATLKEFRGQRQIGQSWVDVAIAQARAIAPYLVPVAQLDRAPDSEYGGRQFESGQERQSKT